MRDFLLGDQLGTTIWVKVGNVSEFSNGRSREAAKQPTNLAKVYDVSQKDNECPAEFLEQIMNTFHCYVHLGPEEAGNSNTVVLVFINQSAPDVRKKLQKLERLGEKSVRDLVEVSEKVYHNKKTKDEKIKTEKLLNRDLAKVLLANGNLDQRERKHQLWNIAEGREPREGCQSVCLL